MTIVEFFDKTSVDNIASTLLCNPDKVIFIGSSGRKIRRSIENFKSVIQARGMDVEFVCKTVSRNNLYEIVDVLAAIVDENSDCVFDMSGGEELYLVALGILEERYKNKVHLRSFNVRNNIGTACDAYGCIRTEGALELSVDENTAVYGGRVIYSDEKGEGTVRRDFGNRYQRRDIFDISEVWRSSGEKWNSMLNSLDRINRYCSTGGRVWVNRDTNKNVLTSDDFELVFNSDFLEKLAEKRIIFKLKRESEEVSFIYRNLNVKKILNKVGNILELFVAITAYDLKDENGKAVYNDVRSGVYIDWDGEIQDRGSADISNEIDVMLMKGTVPVFISCKSGSCSIDELYKLSHVAERFGGKYAKKVLVATSLEKTGATADYIRARAKDMGIRLIENVDTASPQELERIFKSLWRD